MDRRFVSYVKGDGPYQDYWNQWKKESDDPDKDFQDALDVVKVLQFKKEKTNPFVLNAKWQTLKQSIEKIDHKKIHRQLKWMKYASVALLLISVSSILLNFVLDYRYDQISSIATQQVALTTSTGAPSKVILSDGTEVWINSSSKLTYPSVFAGDVREVQLEGEAFFHVTKNKVPFIVHAPRCEVKVYGTRFNVDAYPGQDNSIVALKEGSVSVLDGKNKEHFLKPGMVAEISNTKEILVKEKVEFHRYDDWKSGILTFKNRSLKEISDRLGRKFGVHFHFVDPSIASYKYDLSVSTESLKEIFKLLEYTAPISFEVDPMHEKQINIRVKK
ncbi:FecR domain-containing protein [Halosquirtibacter laminarini]|uniref:FecR domain-containing protein n=1 Tax=Halosquirtibacter laminarini TaxID=3374600 RepID=A0AC61NGL7_9BACT|nr:FecR domain-containing protein [Prolixibacteraceae bacterium]